MIFLELEKIIQIKITLVFIFCTNISFGDNHNINELLELIQKDLKTLEKAVYQKSDIAKPTTLNSIKSDGLNEDIMTKHLLKLNEIEDQFRELTNKFEEVNFKLDKLSTRVTKIQSDSQLRFSDLENGISTTAKKTNSVLPGSTKPQDFGASPGYETSNLLKEQSINSFETTQTVINEEPEKRKSLL